MHPSLARHWDALESRRQAYLANLAATSPAAQAFRPSPQAWSLEDLTQHLWLVERGVVRILETRLEKPPLARDWLSPLKLLLMRLVGHRDFRVRAPVAEIVPRERMAVDALRVEWDRTRAALRGVLERATPEQRAKRIFRHAIFGPMTMAETTEFIWRHHDHHQHQVRRIRGAPGYPG